MNDYELWLAVAPISCKLKIELINNYKRAEDLWYEVINHRTTELLKSNTIKKLLSSYDKIYINKLKNDINKRGIKVASYNDEVYPKRLRNIEDAPYMLFYFGDMKYLNEIKTISVVGSRKCTNYGIDVAKYISREMAKYNVGVISGMARGIDSAAHKGSLESDGYTCAILGSGIDVVYPRENVVLFKEICKMGCIVSEFLPGTKPLAYNFPMRNRIVSALGDVIIIVEAGERSGSLITAGTALDQGKDVMAVPGSIFSDQSKGTNKLIVDGATFFNSIDDVLEILRIEKIDDVGKEKKRENTKVEREICALLCNNPVHIDDIIRITNIDIQLLYEVLFEMQLRNEIRCLSGNYYIKINEVI